MSKIFLNSRPVTGIGGTELPYEHLYLTYFDDSGNLQRSIEGFVDNTFLPLILTGTAGSIDIRYKDQFTTEERNEFLQKFGSISNSIELDLGDRNPDTVWNQIFSAATQLVEANIPYNINVFSESLNSNTILNYLLNSVGIDLQQNLSLLDNILLPGSQELFSQYADRLNVSLLGNQESDILYGGFGDDSLAGFEGDDKLSGYTPLLNSSDFNDTNQYEVDVLVGGSGANLFILGSENERFYDDPDGSEIIPEYFGNSLFVNPINGVQPKSFALLSDFNPEEGDMLQFKGPDTFRDTFVYRDGTSEDLDFPTYRPITIINGELIGILNQQSLSQDFISNLNLSPEYFSTVIVYDVGLNSNQSDLEAWDIVAVIPANSPDALIPEIGFGEQLFV